jgi:hypothetical protein
MKLTIPQYYPSDDTQTPISPLLIGVANLQIFDQTWFQFSFSNNFQLSLNLPPSTESVNNFISIITFNSLGNYDSCSINIP